MYLTGTTVISTGRDGMIRKYVIATDDRLEEISSSKLVSKAWIVGAVMVHRQLLVLTFNARNLQLWSEQDKILLIEIDCGGGHRSWDLFIGTERFHNSGILSAVKESEENPLLRCTYLKNKTVFNCETAFLQKLGTYLKPPLSGKALHSVEVLHNTATESVIIAAGEDTLLHAVVASDDGISKFAYIKRHLSSVRCITAIRSLSQTSENISPHLWLLTAGGRSQFKIWKVSYNTKLPLSSQDTSDFSDPSLHWKEVLSCMINAPAQKLKQEPKFDPEATCMDAIGVWLNGRYSTLALLAIGCSDGYTRFFQFNGNEAKLLSSKYCNSCILKTVVIVFDSDTYIISSTTFGNIFIWKIQELSQHQSHGTIDDVLLYCGRKNLHSCGINSIAHMKNLFLVGLDDGLIKLYVILSDLATDLSSFFEQDCCQNHSAQVSGLSWISDRLFCSASVDQRMIVWRVSKGARWQMNAIKHIHICIPDIHGMRLISDNHNGYNSACSNDEKTVTLCLYGIGIECYDINIS